MTELSKQAPVSFREALVVLNDFNYGLHSNRALIALGMAPCCVDSAEGILAEMGFSEFVPIGLGGYAIVIMLSNTQVVRFADAATEEPRQNLSEILQASYTEILKGECGICVRMEILPKVTTHQMLCEAIGESAATRVFEKGRIMVAESLFQKGYGIIFHDGEDKFANFGITASAKFVATDAECVRNYARYGEMDVARKYIERLKQEYSDKYLKVR